MYKVKLTNSHFKAQNDAEIRDITIGDLLKEISDTHPNSVAMVDVMDDGECGKSWNYSDLFKQSDLLAKALTTFIFLLRTTACHFP